MPADKSPALKYCIANKILVYPVLSEETKGKFKIEAVIKGKKHKFAKEIDAKEIDSALQKTYKYYYDKKQ